MNTQRRILVALPMLVSLSGPAAATDLQEWQLNRIFHPTAKQLQREHQGNIFIYDGLTDRNIEQAMKRQFDRVDSMMFINVIKTDKRGDVVKDPETGAPVTEEDGC